MSHSEKVDMDRIIKIKPDVHKIVMLIDVRVIICCFRGASVLGLRFIRVGYVIKYVNMCRR